MYTNSNKIFKRALKVIPEQTMTFAKAAHNYPENAPKYVKSAEGCWMYDVDGNKFLDFTMGLGTYVLGYNPPNVIKDVISEINNGVLYSLPTENEVILAEKLIKMVKSAEMVRFFKNGADVCTISIRLSQSYNKKNMVAYSGYHGHHEWYSHTLRDSSVPNNIKNNLLNLPVNDEEKTKKLFIEYGSKLTAIIIEISFQSLSETYIKLLHKLCAEYNVSLILDEMWTGFRFKNYTAQNFFKIKPDLSLFSKGMASGFPISCVLGKKKLMTEFNKIWGFTTFGSESLSIQAAISTINEIQKSNVIEYIWDIGDYMMKKLQEIIKNSLYHDTISVVGFPCRFKLNVPTNELGQSLIKSLKERLINENILWNNMFVISGSHKKENIDQFIGVFEEFIQSNDS